MANDKILNLLSGAVKGWGQAQHQKKQREEQKELNALKKQMLNLKQKKQDLINSIIQVMIEKQQGEGGGTTTEPTPGETPDTEFGESFGGLTDMLALAGMPEVAKYFQGKEEFQTREKRITGKNTWVKGMGKNKRPAWLEINYYGKPTGNERPRFERPLTVKGRGPGGRETTSFVDPSQPPGGLITAPSEEDRFIKEANIPLWIHPDTLTSPPVGATPKQAQKQGYKRVTTGTITAVMDFRKVKTLVGNIERLAQKVFPKTESLLGRAIGGFKRSEGARLQTNTDAALLKSMIDGTQAALVRMFEKGTLTDKDISRAKKLNIDLWDDADVVWKKLTNMKNFINDLQADLVGGKKREGKYIGETDETTIRKIIESPQVDLPKQARAQLKEGEKTEFENGQVWILRQGQPVRIK